MSRLLACACCALVLVVFAGPSVAGGKKKAQPNNQMVRGTIKLVDPSKDLLVINQKIKNQVVDRELSILDTTAFMVGGREVVGRDGLRLLEGKEGASVAVKCDKDVNVLKVTVNKK